MNTAHAAARFTEAQEERIHERLRGFRFVRDHPRADRGAILRDEASGRAFARDPVRRIRRPFEFPREHAEVEDRRLVRHRVGREAHNAPAVRERRGGRRGRDLAQVPLRADGANEQLVEQVGRESLAEVDPGGRSRQGVVERDHREVEVHRAFSFG